MSDCYLAMVIDDRVVCVVPFSEEHLDALVKTARAGFSINAKASTMRLWWAHEIDMVFVDVDDPGREMREHEPAHVLARVDVLVREI